MANLKAHPHQRSCQVSSVNVVRSALEESQEKGVKKCTMLVICFLKAKYHILKARNAQAQKGLGTKRVSLPSKHPDRLEQGRLTIYIHFTIKQQYKHNTTSCPELSAEAPGPSPAWASCKYLTWVSLNSKGLLMHVMLFIRVSAHWIQGGKKATLFKDSEYSAAFIINYHSDLLFV